MAKKFKVDKSLEGKPLNHPKGIYDYGRFILNQLRSDGDIQKPDNYMNMALNWGIGSILDWLFEYIDKINQRKYLKSLLNIDDCIYGYNCPETLKELLKNRGQINLQFFKKTLIFQEHYNNEFIKAGNINLEDLKDDTINNNEIMGVKRTYIDTMEYIVLTFASKIIYNPNFDGLPDGYDLEGTPYNFIDYPEGFNEEGKPYLIVDFEDYDENFIPDGYDSQGNPYIFIEFTGFPPDFKPDGFDQYQRPYVFITDYEDEFKEITVNPIFIKINDLEQYYKPSYESYPYEQVIDENGECVLDEEAYRITTKTLNDYGKEYNVPRLEGETNNDYLHRLLMFTRDVSSICGFRKYVAEMLKIPDSDIKTEFIFKRFKAFETTLRQGETRSKRASFSINRIESDNKDGQFDDEADITISRTSPDLSNQLILKMTIPCGFDLEWVYNQFVDLLPIGLLFEVWDECGNYYPSLFTFDLLMCTNLHLLTNHIFLLNSAEMTSNENAMFQSVENKGGTYVFDIPGYNTPHSIIKTEGYNYVEYISRDVKGVMMVNPRESFVLELMIKAIKKNEFMFKKL